MYSVYGATMEHARGHLEKTDARAMQTASIMGKHKITMGTLCLTAMVVLSLAIPGQVVGPQIPPHLLVAATSINGVPAPEGTVVTAWIRGQQVASGEVGSYGDVVLVISGPARRLGYRYWHP